MEGFYWFRISLIAVMFFGGLYVLSPSVLQESADARLAKATSQVDSTQAPAGADLTLQFEVEGDAVTMMDAVNLRLGLAGVSARARLNGDGDFRVHLDAGTRKENVRAVLKPQGALRVLALADPEESPEIEDWTSWIGALVPLPDEMEGEAITVVEQDRLLKLEVESDREGQYLLMDGVVLARVASEGMLERPAPWSNETRATLLAGGWPGGLSEMETAQPETEEAPAVEEEETVVVPAWYEGLLPDTAINLGLDLQGGIDLTLQVGLDEAIIGQASRDATYLRGKAQNEERAFELVRGDRNAPTIWVTTDEPLSDVQDYLQENMARYVYEATEGNRHGFTMQSERQEEVRKQVVEQVLETLRKRVDETGVKEPSIVKKGGGSINVQLPGMTDYQQAVDALGTTAVLEFRLHDGQFDDALREQMLRAAEAALPEEQYLDDDTLNDWLWTTRRLDEDRRIGWLYQELPDGVLERDYPLVLFNEIMLTGNDVNNASVQWDQNNQPNVSLEFKPRGARVFCDVTTEHVREQFAIMLDGQVRSAPSIREPICGGAASIEMGAALDATKEAQTLALVLRTGSLDAPVVISQVRQVGASLGQDSIRKGGTATLVGGAIVLLFMLLWYRSAGLIADTALVVNVVLVLALLALFGATLTLPGIAGIALTIGMAVDANIIIYERIREELKLGVSPRKAVDMGFEKAMVAVLDANITTAIAGVVLYSYGTGPIKGFAVTLLIGIITTLFTALFVTRTLFELVTRNSSARLSI